VEVFVADLHCLVFAVPTARYARDFSCMVHTSAANYGCVAIMATMAVLSKSLDYSCSVEEISHCKTRMHMGSSVYFSLKILCYVFFLQSIAFCFKAFDRKYLKLSFYHII